jgi:pilus assembly protein CpaB
MNRRLTSAILVALVISGLFTFWLSTRVTKTHVAPPPAKKQYVAAAANLEADQVIRAENLRLIDWPATVPLNGAFSNPGALIGRIVLFPLSEGEPILERQLSSPGAGIGITAKIPNGMRLIALRSDEVVGVAGFLLPGTHVDVLVTLRPTGSTSTSSNSDTMTFTVLQDAEVLSAGQKTEPDPEGKATVSTVVTLLVKPEDAERVVLASNQGTVHFVLRNGVDREEFKGPPALLAQLTSNGAPVPVKEAPKPPELLVVKTYTVETILGKQPRMDEFQ